MKTVFITGANRGIGQEMVSQYWADGWRVIACSRTLENRTEKERLLHVELDVTDPVQIKNLAARLDGETIDVLINNAGVSGPDTDEMEMFSSDAWLETFQVNTVAPFMIAQALKNQVGRSRLKIIANLSSIYGSVALNADSSNFCIYRASKAALNSVTKCLANAFRELGITVISIHPGSVRTDMNPDGRISPKESVNGIKKVLNSLHIKDSGSFVDYTHALLPW